MGLEDGVGSMNKIAALLFLAVLGLAAAPQGAQAQATRTWVSGVGDDVNPCSRTAPCKTFAGAISKTAAKGEINCLDPGGFGTVTITKSISIICEGVTGGVLAAGTNGVVVNTASTDKVLLDGLDIEGFGTGINGVTMVGGGKLTIRRSSIRNFTQNGVNLAGTANARVFIMDSLITGNTLSGFLIQGAAGVANSGLLDRVTIDTNAASSVKIGTNGSLTISGGSQLVGSGVALDIGAGATVTSYGDNVIRGSGAPTTTLPRT